jgi:hypothetical protein
MGILLSILALGPANEVSVRVQDGVVQVHARSARLADVLDRLSEKTGMRVVYDGARPGAVVTLDGAWRTSAEAVLAILEGSGTNYAFATDESRTRVTTLVINGPATPSSLPAGGNRATVPAGTAPRPAFAPPGEEAEPDTESTEGPPSIVPPGPPEEQPTMAPPPYGARVPAIVEPPSLPYNPSSPPLPPEGI